MVLPAGQCSFHTTDSAISHFHNSFLAPTGSLLQFIRGGGSVEYEPFQTYV